MKRFKWSLYKTLEYLKSRRNDLNLKQSYLNQLNNLENRLFKSESEKSLKWDDECKDIEESVLKNT